MEPPLISAPLNKVCICTYTYVGFIHYSDHHVVSTSIPHCVFVLLSRIHDRKISVLGFCAVMQCQLRPAAVISMAREIVPAMLVQLDGLKDSYQSESNVSSGLINNTYVYTCECVCTYVSC